MPAPAAEVGSRVSPNAAASRSRYSAALVCACWALACTRVSEQHGPDVSATLAQVAAPSIDSAASQTKITVIPSVEPPPVVSAERATASCPEGMQQVVGGSFWVGTSGTRGPDDEHPRFQTQVTDFCLDRTEVTARNYDACVEQKACEPAARDNLTCNAGRAGRQQHPSNCVSFRQADAYCKAQGRRLPSEVEWEYAARGGAEYRAFSFGSGSPDDRVCWKQASSCAVGSFPAGAFGLLDMTGNVWEWTSTRYGRYPWGDADNPNRVYRGGSWSRRFEKWLSPTLRNRFGETQWGSHLGFRCAADLPGAKCSSAEPGAGCGLEVTAAECPAETTWNGVRCARADAPTCAPGWHVVKGQGCRPAPSGATVNTTAALAVEAVAFSRTPEFDADCREFQPQRPVAFRLVGATHPDRTLAAKQQGCKNRDVGVGWNSACCPQR